MSVRNLLPSRKGSVILSASLLCKLKIKASLGWCSRPSQNGACFLWCGLTNKELQRVREEPVLTASRAF